MALGEKNFGNENESIIIICTLKFDRRFFKLWTKLISLNSYVLKLQCLLVTKFHFKHKNIPFNPTTFPPSPPPNPTPLSK